jgi:Mce-associated membrane protein
MRSGQEVTMRSRKRSPEEPDAGHGDDRGDVIDSDGPQSRSGLDSDAEASIPQADAEDEVAKAEALAQAARARLLRLRETAETSDADDDVSQDAEQAPAKRTRARLRRLRRPARLRRLRRPGRARWLRRPGRKAVAVGAGIVVATASLGASGYMVWQHHTIEHNRQLSAEFAAAARQQVTMLMSIDANHAKEDFQRILDSSTGDLKNQLSVMAGLMAKQAEDSKVSSTATVQAVAVESVSANSGVVLVAAKSEATGPDNAKRPPALFRLSVDLTRDGGQLKMSKVDFLQ